MKAPIRLRASAASLTPIRARGTSNAASEAGHMSAPDHAPHLHKRFFLRAHFAKAGQGFR